MNCYEVEFKCETPLLAKCQKRVNTFFYFPDFYFYPLLVRLPHYLTRPAKSHLLAERTKVCQHFFVNIFYTRRLRLGNSVSECPRF